MLIYNIIGFVILLSLYGVSEITCKAVDVNSLEDGAAEDDDHMKFTHEWAVKIDDPLEADLIAMETKSINMGLIAPFNNVYLFVSPNVPKRHRRAAHEHHERLVNHEKVRKNRI